MRVVGRVEKCSRQENVEYFGGRPRGSRIGAWASSQSEVVKEGELEIKVKEMEERFGEEQEVECPEHWGGWRVVPL